MTEKHIEDSSAPLLDHLIELRTRLIRSILAFVVAMMVCFAFAEPLFEFLAEPIKQAMLNRGHDPTLIFTGAHKGIPSGTWPVLIRYPPSIARQMASVRFAATSVVVCSRPSRPASSGKRTMAPRIGISNSRRSAAPIEHSAPMHRM